MIIMVLVMMIMLARRFRLEFSVHHLRCFISLSSKNKSIVFVRMYRLNDIFNTIDCMISFSLSLSLSLSFIFVLLNMVYSWNRVTIESPLYSLQQQSAISSRKTRIKFFTSF